MNRGHRLLTGQSRTMAGVHSQTGRRSTVLYRSIVHAGRFSECVAAAVVLSKSARTPMWFRRARWEEQHVQAPCHRTDCDDDMQRCTVRGAADGEGGELEERRRRSSSSLSPSITGIVRIMATIVRITVRIIAPTTAFTVRITAIHTIDPTIPPTSTIGRTPCMPTATGRFRGGFRDLTTKPQAARAADRVARPAM
jgi:hypothetical protein